MLNDEASSNGDDSARGLCWPVLGVSIETVMTAIFRDNPDDRG